VARNSGLRERLLAATLALALFSLWSCAGFNRTHRRVDSAPPLHELEALAEDHADLTLCLDRLGPPTSVERSQDETEMVLTWTWDEQDAWGFFISVPSGTHFSPSLNWADVANQPQFVRLFFDSNWTLVDIAQG